MPSNYEIHLNTIVKENAIEGRSDGMSWTIYYFQKYKLTVTKENVELIISSGDCISNFMSLFTQNT